MTAAHKLKAMFKVVELQQPETSLEKISRLLGKQSKAQDEDQQMEEQKSEEDLFKEPSEHEDQQEPFRTEKSESVVSEDDIF